MILAVISDTHLSSPSSWLEQVYERHLAGADALLHCGDITGYETWSFFSRHPNFYAAQGNCDYDPRLSDELQPMLRLELGGLRIGLAHGWGPRSQVPIQVAQAFGPGFDLICYGHTHNAFYGRVEGLNLLNPGSLGDPPHSLALVEIGPDKGLDVRFLTA